MGEVNDPLPMWQRWIPTAAIQSILPRLADEKIDWKKPLCDWTADEMTAFISLALHHVRNVMVERQRTVPFDDEIPWQ